MRAGGPPETALVAAEANGDLTALKSQPRDPLIKEHRMRVTSLVRTSTLWTMPEATRTELAVLGLLAWAGEASGYELNRRAERSVGFIWAPARSQLYAVLKR